LRVTKNVVKINPFLLDHSFKDNLSF